jgi:hypothetical protein
MISIRLKPTLKRSLLTLIIYLSLPIQGHTLEFPHPDPTIAPSHTTPSFYDHQKATLQTNIFTTNHPDPLQTQSHWLVELIKIYPNNRDNNWAIIQGKRVGIGSKVLGGVVVALSKNRLELQHGAEYRSLILLSCEALSEERLASFPEPSHCQGLYFFIEFH